MAAYFAEGMATNFWPSSTVCVQIFRSEASSSNIQFNAIFLKFRIPVSTWCIGEQLEEIIL
jgi:hypothetical protein